MERGRFHVFYACTGGVGATIFYVSGLMMALGAGAILVARGQADEE